MYKNLLKKRYGPVLEHNLSCMTKLKIERTALMRLLANKRYRKYRVIKCKVCRKNLDKLSNKNKIVSFTRPIIKDKKTYYQWNGFWSHKKCAPKVKVPKGWGKS